MNVGDAAHRSGLPAKTIRYYEEIGLIAPARAGNGYRDYSGDDIHRLAFLRRARNLGFSIDDCRQLMALYQDRSRASHDVREIAAAHVTRDRGEGARVAVDALDPAEADPRLPRRRQAGLPDPGRYCGSGVGDGPASATV